MAEDKLNKTEFRWFLGVIEDRNDPLGLKRCRVRIFGKHSENVNLIPTNSLPWAYDSRTSGVTDSKKEGDWCFGFFMDGEQEQQPIIIGIIDGITESLGRVGTGFCDNRTEEQIQNSPTKQRNPKFPNEPSTSRLYRGISDGTVIETIKNSLIDGQPEPSFNPKQPYNNVYESETGHAIELDDTPNNERVQISHKNGSYVEFRNDGDVVEKIIKDNYTIVAGNDNVIIKGNCDVKIDGNVNINVSGNCDLNVGGNVNAGVGGNINATVGGSITAKVGGTLAISSGGGSCDVSFGNINMKGNIKLDGDVTVSGKSVMRGHTTLYGVTVIE